MVEVWACAATIQQGDGNLRLQLAFGNSAAEARATALMNMAIGETLIGKLEGQYQPHTQGAEHG